MASRSNRGRFNGKAVRCSRGRTCFRTSTQPCGGSSSSDGRIVDLLGSEAATGWLQLLVCRLRLLVRRVRSSGQAKSSGSGVLWRGPFLMAFRRGTFRLSPRNSVRYFQFGGADPAYRGGFTPSRQADPISSKPTQLRSGGTLRVSLLPKSHPILQILQSVPRA